jgi:predicted DNA-binding ribbon-helix-helix protein
VTRLVNRNVTALGGRTSIRLEPELWEALDEICRREAMTLAEVVRAIERRGHAGGRTSAVRVEVLAYFRRAATETGHLAAGHGALPDEEAPPQPRVAVSARASSAASRRGTTGPV